MQHHYFLNVEHKKEDYFSFTDYFLGQPYLISSCTDVFSKNEIDYGTQVLLKTIIEKIKLNGVVLDVGCGYGIIGIVLKKHFPETLINMIDINVTAVELSIQNCEKNKVQANVFVSNLYEKVDFLVDHIVTNPPIKAGKDNLFSVVINGFEKLKKTGTITLVIKKKHGMESLKNKMEEIFGNVQILKRDSGYYILHSVKN